MAGKLSNLRLNNTVWPKLLYYCSLFCQSFVIVFHTEDLKFHALVAFF